MPSHPISLLTSPGIPQVDFAGQRCQTAVRRETYDPDWEEAFAFDIRLPDGEALTSADAAFAGPGTLRATLQHRNRVGGPEKIGEAVIGSGRMWDVVRAPLGWEEDSKFPVRRGGKVCWLASSSSLLSALCAPACIPRRSSTSRLARTCARTPLLLIFSPLTCPISTQ
jgi:hypothetical protein